jgi:hypothetical protein
VQTDCSAKTGARQVAHPFGAIVRLLMLTGQRREEVAAVAFACGAKFSNDFDGRVQTERCPH